VSGAARGRVYLVGAGPGDPDLITVRGAELLRSADVVVHDALVAPELLELAPAGAELIDVGKRGHDPPTRTQEEIHALLVDRAKRGLAVVRLKGGDPFVFGRGGEEARACAEAGIPFEVVPGVTAAVAVPAYAGIPVTDRHFAASFAVITGHRDPGAPRERLRVDRLADAADTLVLLMGRRHLRQLARSIVEGGRDPATPAVAIEWGTLPRQRVVEGTLGDLPDRVEAAGLEAPVTVVVGGVVALRHELGWYERLPLHGVRVLVTRAAEQAGAMLRELRRAGAWPVLLPLLRFEPPEDRAPLAAALRHLSGYDAVVFTSQNAVRFTARASRELGVDLATAGVRIACVGPRTADAARGEGLPVHLVPLARFDAGAMAETLRELLPPRGRRFLLPRASGGRELLGELLRAEGARVDEVVAYRNLPAEVDEEVLRHFLEAPGPRAFTFASPSAVRRLAAVLGPRAAEELGRGVVAAIGPVTARALEEIGARVDAVPARADGVELVRALAAHRFAGPEGARGEGGEK